MASRLLTNGCLVASSPASKDTRVNEHWKQYQHGLTRTGQKVFNQRFRGLHSAYGVYDRVFGSQVMYLLYQLHPQIVKSHAKIRRCSPRESFFFLVNQDHLCVFRLSFLRTALTSFKPQALLSDARVSASELVCPTMFHELSSVGFCISTQTYIQLPSDAY